MIHHVVVIGAGYAGLPAAERLARQVRPDEVAVTLISAFDTFVERPRLHQLAVGQQIEQVSLAEYLGGTGIHQLTASVTNIDLKHRQVLTVDAAGREQTVPYQTLVYALGSNIAMSTVPGVGEHCAALVDAAAARALRPRLQALARSHGTVAICGGGLTGIEIATEIAESFPTLHIKLVSAHPPGDWLSERARVYLHTVFDRLGVEVTDGARVDRVEDGAFVLTGGRSVSFDLGIWAGGFSVPTLARSAGLAVNADGRALVDDTLRSVSDRQVYVIGDAAAVAGSWGTQLAMGCRTGGFTGPQVADMIAARLTGTEPDPFRFRYLHECISLGRRHGLVQFFTADGTPKDRILKGRKAITYKNLTLNGAKVLFRHPGPMIRRRRHVSPLSALTPAH